MSQHRAKSTQWDAMTIVLLAVMLLAIVLVVMAVAW